jgi:hypothetical protein
MLLNYQIQSDKPDLSLISSQNLLKLMPFGTGTAADNYWLQFRNSFYWNKKQMIMDGANLKYTDAEDTQWFHESDLSTMSGQVESVTQPLESRVYRACPNSNSLSRWD